MKLLAGIILGLTFGIPVGILLSIPITAILANSIEGNPSAKNPPPAPFDCASAQRWIERMERARANHSCAGRVGR